MLFHDTVIVSVEEDYMTPTASTVADLYLHTFLRSERCVSHRALVYT